MVGAMVVGDLFWSFEELLNKLTEKKIKAGSSLYDLLGELVAYLNVSKKDLIQVQSADEPIQYLIDSAVKLSNNEAINETIETISETIESRGIGVSVDQDGESTKGLKDEVESESQKTTTATEATADTGQEATEEDVDPLVVIYLEELAELLGAFELTTQVLVEDSTNIDAIADAERQLHTIKGGARMTGLLAIGDLSHIGESLLNKVSQNKVSVDDGLLVKLQDVSDELYRMYEKAASGNEIEPATHLIKELEKLFGEESNVEEKIIEESSAEVTELEQADSITEDNAKKVDPLVTIYLEELAELLEAFESTTQVLVEDPNDTGAIADAERQLHTIKGGARMTGLLAIGDLSHIGESLLNKVSQNKVNADDGLLVKLQEVSDELYRMYEKVASGSDIEPATGLIKELQRLAGEEEPTDAESTTEAQVELDTVDEQDEESIDEESIDEESIDEESIDEESSKEETGSIETQKSESKVVDKSAKIFDLDFSSKSNVSGLEKLLSTCSDDLNTSMGSLLPRIPQKEVKVGKRSEGISSIKVPTEIINELISTTNEWGHHNMLLVEQYEDSGKQINELKRTAVKLKEQVRALEVEADSLINSGNRTSSLPKIMGSFDPLEMDDYAELQQQSRILAESLGDLVSLTEGLDGGLKLMEKTIKEQASSFKVLQDGLIRTRMTKVSSLSSRLKRIVRQTAAELGKNIEFEIADEECELDRTILERITASLEHLIRNSVAHGIELPDLRKQHSKPETGKIVLAFNREGPEVVITLKDDGQGIDVEKLKQASIKKGLIDENENISDQEAYQLILMSGISTAESVSQVAGRGVGMDVVNSEINSLGGNIVIDSERGVFTRFTLRVPYNLATNQVMMLEVSNFVLSIPVAKLEGMQRVSAAKLLESYSSQNPTIDIEGKNYVLKHLGRTLGLGETPTDMAFDITSPVILLEENRQRIAYHVDEIIGSREVMLKPLGPLFEGSRLLSSATILGGGNIVLLLNSHELIRMGIASESMERVEVDSGDIQCQTTVLVVDDSITVRKVTETLLGKLNYNVITATDGFNALEILESEVPNIMLLDIEMPRMDGFELLERLRSSEEWERLPVIMISSRSGARHRDHAESLGATSFIGKPWEAKQLSMEIKRCLEKTNLGVTA